MKQKLKKTTYWASVVTLGLVVGISLQLARANWSAPATTAPNGNIGAPINTGDNSQNKAGTLGVGKNLVIGTSTPTTATAPNGRTEGNIYSNDLYINSAGKWASEISGGTGSAGALYGTCIEIVGQDRTTGGCLNQSGACSGAKAPAICDSSRKCTCSAGYSKLGTGTTGCSTMYTCVHQ